MFSSLAEKVMRRFHHSSSIVYVHLCVCVCVYHRSEKLQRGVEKCRVHRNHFIKVDKPLQMSVYGIASFSNLVFFSKLSAT